MNNPNKFITSDGYESSLPRRISDARIVLDLLAAARGRRITSQDSLLDIGCGPVGINRALWEKGEDCPGDLWGLDIVDYGHEPFWNGHQRRFIAADFLQWDLPSDIRFNVVWSSFAAHCITAPDDEEGVSRGADFFARVADLLAPNGRFVCIQPGAEDFFPLLKEIGGRALQEFAGITKDRYDEARKKRYHFWQDIPQITESAEEASLVTHLAVRMYSWQAISAPEAFESWRSANPHVLKDLCLDPSDPDLKIYWMKAVESAVADGNVHRIKGGEDLLGYTNALVFILSASKRIQNRSHKEGLPSSVPWSVVFKCHEEALKAEATNTTLDGEISYSGAKKIADLRTEFHKRGEPVFSELLSHGELKEKVIYAMRLVESRDGQQAKDRQPNPLVFKNDQFFEANRRRSENLETIVKKELSFSRLNPKTIIQRSKGYYAISCLFSSGENYSNVTYQFLSDDHWPKDDDCLARLAVISPSLSVQSSLNAGFEGHLRDMPRPSTGGQNGLVVLFPAKDKAEDFFETGKDIASRSGILNYFCWQTDIHESQLFMLCNVSVPETKEELVSVALSLALSDHNGDKLNLPADLMPLSLCLWAACIPEAARRGRMIANEAMVHHISTPIVSLRDELEKLQQQISAEGTFNKKIHLCRYYSDVIWGFYALTYYGTLGKKADPSSRLCDIWEELLQLACAIAAEELNRRLSHYITTGGEDKLVNAFSDLGASPQTGLYDWLVKSSRCEVGCIQVSRYLIEAVFATLAAQSVRHGFVAWARSPDDCPRTVIRTNDASIVISNRTDINFDPKNTHSWHTMELLNRSGFVSIDWKPAVDNLSIITIKLDRKEA